MKVSLLIFCEFVCHHFLFTLWGPQSVEGCDIKVQVCTNNGQHGYIELDGVRVQFWQCDEQDAGETYRSAYVTYSCKYFKSLLPVRENFLSGLYSRWQLVPKGAFFVIATTFGGFPSIKEWYSNDTGEVYTKARPLLEAWGLPVRTTSNELSSMFENSHSLVVFARKSYYSEIDKPLVQFIGEDELYRIVEFSFGSDEQFCTEALDLVESSASSVNITVHHNRLNLLISEAIGCWQSVKAWEFIPVKPGKVTLVVARVKNVVDYKVIGSTKVTITNSMIGDSTSVRYKCIRDNPITGIEPGDVYGLYTNANKQKLLPIKRVFPSEEASHHSISHSVIWLHHKPGADPHNTPPTSVIGSVALRPIFSSDFVYTCGCERDVDCTMYGDANMKCRSSSCGCRTGYIYNRLANKCLLVVSSGEQFTGSTSNSSSAIYWWVLDLEKVTNVFAMELVVPSADADYVKNFTVGISVHFDGENFDTEDFQRCVNNDDDIQVVQGKKLLFNCEQPIPGRYVAMYSHRMITLSHFQVHTAPGCYASDPNTCIFMNRCDEIKHGCQQLCRETPKDGGYKCECESGYELDDTDCVTCHDVDECQTRNGGCQHKCNNTLGSYSCECDHGYKLSADLESCEDIDECTVNNGGCDQVCQNYMGSFDCGCYNGAQLSEGWTVCEGPNSVLMSGTLDMLWHALYADSTSKKYLYLKQQIDRNLDHSICNKIQDLEMDITCNVVGSFSNGSVEFEFLARAPTSLTLLQQSKLSVLVVEAFAAVDNTLEIGDNKVRLKEPPALVTKEISGMKAKWVVGTECDFLTSMAYCLNGGKCTMRGGQPVCGCDSGYVGSQCDVYAGSHKFKSESTMKGLVIGAAIIASMSIVVVMSAFGGVKRYQANKFQLQGPQLDFGPQEAQIETRVSTQHRTPKYERFADQELLVPTRKTNFIVYKFLDFSKDGFGGQEFSPHSSDDTLYSQEEDVKGVKVHNFQGFHNFGDFPLPVRNAGQFNLLSGQRAVIQDHAMGDEVIENIDSAKVVDLTSVQEFNQLMDNLYPTRRANFIMGNVEDLARDMASHRRLDQNDSDDTVYSEEEVLINQQQLSTNAKVFKLKMASNEKFVMPERRANFIHHTAAEIRENMDTNRLLYSDTSLSDYRLSDEDVTTVISHEITSVNEFQKLMEPLHLIPQRRTNFVKSNVAEIAAGMASSGLVPSLSEAELLAVEAESEDGVTTSEITSVIEFNSLLKVQKLMPLRRANFIAKNKKEMERDIEAHKIITFPSSDTIYSQEEDLDSIKVQEYITDQELQNLRANTVPMRRKNFIANSDTDMARDMALAALDVEGCNRAIDSFYSQPEITQSVRELGSATQIKRDLLIPVRKANFLTTEAAREVHLSALAPREASSESLYSQEEIPIKVQDMRSATEIINNNLAPRRKANFIVNEASEFEEDIMKRRAVRSCSSESVYSQEEVVQNVYTTQNQVRSKGKSSSKKIHMARAPARITTSIPNQNQNNICDSLPSNGSITDDTSEKMSRTSLTDGKIPHPISNEYDFDLKSCSEFQSAQSSLDNIAALETVQNLATDKSDSESSSYYDAHLAASYVPSIYTPEKSDIEPRSRHQESRKRELSDCCIL